MPMSVTERLFIREFTTDDAAFIIDLVNTPSWLRYIGDRKVKTKEDAIRYLENGPIKSYKDHGFGLNMVMLKGEALPIGMCGLIKRDTLDDVDIGFAFLPSYEKKGYAFEAASAMLKTAQSLGLKRVVAITLPINESSVRLLKKLNMQFEKTIRFPGEEQELLMFGINY